MKNWIIKSNQYYDDIKEPWRFLILLVLVVILTSGTVLTNNTTFIWYPIGTLVLVTWRFLGHSLNKK